MVADGGSDAGPCNLACSTDHQSIIDCHGATVMACAAGQACDLTTFSCADPCTAAVDARGSVGCEFYAPHPEMDYPGQCFAAFIANTWTTPAHLTVEWSPGSSLDVTTFGRIPSGTGANIQYAPYDANAGLAPGQVVILFLAGYDDPTSPSNVPCPVTKTAIPQGSVIQATGTRQAFHLTSDVPVAAYQMSPYGGVASFITGASLLLPTSAWDTNYVAVTAAAYSSTTMDNPSLNIVASQDGTQVTVLPSQAIVGGGGLPAGPANLPYLFTLDKGQQAQLSQQADLTGSIIQTSRPVAVLGANACMQAPLGTSFCDHGEQMLPPVKALGSEYAAVMFRPRVTGDQAIWHLVGTVDGTTLTYSNAVGGPASLSAGQVVDFMTDVPFVVTSQDASHPFMLFAYMTGSQWSGLSDRSGYGDPDIVLGVPPQQFQRDYTFYADLSFPENDLVIVRAQDPGMSFEEVTLDCAGALTGWQPVGAYQWTRVDLTRHDFASQGSCSSGPHRISSSAPFGLWVWGWGSPETLHPDAGAPLDTRYVSYGFPAGMGVKPINAVLIPAVSH
jgi:hypothetical protein